MELNKEGTIKRNLRRVSSLNEGCQGNPRKTSIATGSTPMKKEFKRNVSLSGRRRMSTEVKCFIRRKSRLRLRSRPLIEAQAVDEKGKLKAEPLLLWKRVARIVRMLCAVCIALRKYAMEAGLLENYSVAISTKRRRNQGGGDEEEEEELSFNLDDFKLTKEVKVPKAIMDLMEKPSHSRSSDELYAISSMMRDLPSFRKYTRDMQTMMCKIVRYMKCGRRRVVLRKGHIGYSVYFIFSGSVNVVLDQDEQNVFVKERILTLKKGACFGEVALMQNTRRNATIVCADETEFLVIDKEDFLENGLDRQMQEEFTVRFTFFREWTPLHHWSDEQIKILSSICRTEEFHHNRLIAKDASKNDWLWFVIQGSCEILRWVNLNESPNYRTILSLQSSSGSTPIQRSSSPLSRKIFPRAQSAPQKPKSRRQGRRHPRPESSLGFAGAASKVQSRNDISSHDQKAGIYVKVDTLRDGSCFGLEDLNQALRRNDSSQHLSIISRGCTIIHIPRSRFKELADDLTISLVKPLVKKYPTDDELCQDFFTKVKWDFFKHNLVGKVLDEPVDRKSARDGLRTCLRKESRATRENTFICDHIDTREAQLPRPQGTGTERNQKKITKISTNPKLNFAMWKLTDTLQSSKARGDRFRMNPQDRSRLLLRATTITSSRSSTSLTSHKEILPSNGKTLLVTETG